MTRKLINETIEEQSIDLGDMHIHGCTFRRCQIVFSGTPPKHLSHSTFEDCKWQFDGQAAGTVNFLAFLYAQGDPFRYILDEVFACIYGGRSRKVPVH